MEINRANIMDIVKEFDLRPDKDYGQNFLIEPDISKRIVDLLDIQKGEKILEIGPGLGSLTHFLVDYDNSVDVVDIDSRMIKFIEYNYKDFDNLKCVENDIRRHDVGRYNKVIGNLPYNITTELVNYLVSNATNCTKFVLMCQLEALNRFIDLSGKDYGPLSILIHLLGQPKKEFIVKHGCFYPVPKCASVVFSITMFDNLDKNLCVEVYKFTKIMFGNRRKTIYNNLCNFIKNKELAKSVLDLCGIESIKRPEEIEFLKYVDLYKAYKNL